MSIPVTMRVRFMCLPDGKERSRGLGPVRLEERSCSPFSDCIRAAWLKVSSNDAPVRSLVWRPDWEPWLEIVGLRNETSGAKFRAAGCRCDRLTYQPRPSASRRI